MLDVEEVTLCILRIKQRQEILEKTKLMQQQNNVQTTKDTAVNAMANLVSLTVTTPVASFVMTTYVRYAMHPRLCLVQA